MTAALAYLDGLDASLAVDSTDAAVFFDAQPTPSEIAIDSAIAEATAAPVPVKVVPSSLLKSELPNVSDEAWTKFALAMRTAAVDSVSGSNALGAWEMRPKRLADLGLMGKLRYERTAAGRLACDGDFTEPMTKRKFLENAGVQYRVFSASMKRYVDGLGDGSVPQPNDIPEDMTLSGALAILHRCGPGGLAKWSDPEARFSDTQDLYSKTNGMF